MYSSEAKSCWRLHKPSVKFFFFLSGLKRFLVIVFLEGLVFYKFIEDDYCTV